MGTAVSAILGGETKPSKDVQEQLTFLVASATERLNRYQTELENGFSDKTSIQRKSIPGNRAIRWAREYTVDVTEGASTNVNTIVDGFFAVGKAATDPDEDPKKKKDNVVEGFKSIVNGSLKAFIGNAEAGEHEEEKFFVFVQHNAIIRIDVRLWRYNFSSDGGAIAGKKNVLCYIICASVVDRAALTFDEMIYLLSEHAGDDKVEAYIDDLARIWKKMEILPRRIDETPKNFA
ncbi:hypothetical protein RSOLAG1IB_08634 [Rhizoctonia solani AG-1 IB]|uniref:Uncharacterized protein n=1 Tax=Thanatephorus cucumeris (strain AG1-IB / isolate 7/3/14) TaxID=1108050 RepID=A0A0B7FNU8_THACB|nr:hypothetical protein RSOLAG1IB_08634 [Rhizoctonia solani AG-1 IB]